MCIIILLAWCVSMLFYKDGLEDLKLELRVQFELECRPFYVAGFNAHDLVPKSLADPTAHKTEGPSLPRQGCTVLPGSVG